MTSYIFEAPFADEVYLGDEVARIVTSNSNQQMLHGGARANHWG